MSSRSHHSSGSRHRGLLGRATAVAALAATATLGLGVAGADAATEPSPDARSGSAATASGIGPNTPLWFITARHTGMSMVPSVSVSGLGWQQRTIPSTYNPLFSGQLYAFHYDVASDSYIVEANGGGCLDIADGISKAANAKLSVRGCDGTVSQMWESHVRDGGWYLKNEWSGLYATVPGYANNVNGVQQVDNHSANQRFDMPLFTG